MKIQEIHIYGYGKLENTVIRNIGDFSVFYGKNEAGKSTIMAFIHSILFGFPKKQTTELRYEPKTGGKYGGKLIVLFPEKGRVSIERVKGKAAGDVTVLLEDGTTGGEELLKELLSRIDKNVYTSIFSFNLHGLQNVHHLKSDDLGKFLFSTGAVGSEALMFTEKNLQKELDSRFKPSGKKPVINVKLREAKELKERLTRGAAQNDQYRALLLKQEQLEKRLAAAEEQKSLLQRQIHRLEEWKKLCPVIEEMTGTEEQLRKMGDSTFPIDGLARLERLNELLQPVKAEISSLSDKRDKLKKNLADLEPNRAILEKELEIIQASENLNYYEALKQEDKEWKGKLKAAEQDIGFLREKLHLSVTDSELLQMNTSIFMKEQTGEAVRKQIRLQERKEELDRSFQEEKDSLERFEERVMLLEKSILPPEERKRKEEALHLVKSSDAMKREAEELRERLRFLEKSLSFEQKLAGKRRIQALFLSLFFLVLMIWGFWNSQWVIGIGGVLGLLFFFFTSFLAKNNQHVPDLKAEIERLSKKEKELTAGFNHVSMEDISLLEDELKKDDEVRSELEIAKIHLKQQEEQYEKVIKGYEIWEKEMLEHREILKNLANELHLPENIAFKHIADAFQLLSQLKERVKERDRISEMAEEKSKAFMALHNELISLKMFFYPDSPLSVREAITRLRKTLNEELEKQIRFGKEEELLRETEENLEKFKVKAKQLIEERENLFRLANCDNEEVFRYAGKQEEERGKLRRKLDDLKNKLHLSPLSLEEIGEFSKLDEVDPELETIQRKISDCREQMHMLNAELSDIKHQIALLEEGREYGQLLHKYRQLISELEDEAKEWAKYAVAKNLLRKTIERFQNEHFPNMLRKAEEFLSFLTEGNYIRIMPKKDSSGFLLERKDGLRFEANELSQATAEQVYVALRLALTATIYKKLPFPIIIDDSFVNFDKNRAERAIELLRKIKDNQIMFFTCHDHFLPYFTEQMIIKLEEGRERPSY